MQVHLSPSTHRDHPHRVLFLKVILSSKASESTSLNPIFKAILLHRQLSHKMLSLQEAAFFLGKCWEKLRLCVRCDFQKVGKVPSSELNTAQCIPVWLLDLTPWDHSSVKVLGLVAFHQSTPRLVCDHQGAWLSGLQGVRLLWQHILGSSFPACSREQVREEKCFLPAFPCPLVSSHQKRNTLWNSISIFSF